MSTLSAFREAQQDDLLRTYGARLNQLEQRLQEQGHTLKEQDTLLKDQADKLKEQASVVSHQEKLLRQQDVKLAQQERSLALQGQIIQQLLDRNHKNRKPEEQKAETLNLHPATTDGTPAVELETEPENETGLTSSLPHDVIERADDGGPLEVVVSQLSQQVTQMNADVQAFKTQTTSDIHTLQSSNSQQDVNIQDARTSTFVHWGSSQCGSSAQLVYSGVVGGSWYNDPGAAANYLCLTMSPVLSSRSLPSAYAHLFGAEYETKAEHFQEDPVCAVCRAAFSTTIMIPGTNVCSPGWHLQYNGYLMANHYAYNAQFEYVCVDSSLESSQHSAANENGALFHFTATVCGSLPCPPYANNKVVTCAVCSK